MLRNLGYRDYENFSGIDDIGMGRLARVYSKAVNKRKAEDIDRDERLQISIPHLEVVKQKIAETISPEFDEIGGHLPIASVFDALQVVKSRKDAKRNAGLRALGAHLDNIWRRNRTANLSANTFLNLKDYYIRNYPKSGLDEVFDEISKKGYFTLPISDLMQIASQIETQEDFNNMMVKHGLNGKHPHQIKARKFIIAAINGEEF